ncbi:MAG: hypothetical protein K6T30_01270 [Alicyclobacillus sp.]|nr:hypothetical protein [Alicyclobacillus sp.]
MRGRFRVRAGSRWRRLLLALAAAVVVAGGFELYRVIIPFQPVNPLWEEATIGEPVIDDWQYEGLNEEGYLKFYNHGQTVLLPPGAHMFGADGKFVVIEHYSPNSLTFAKPYEAVPATWIVAGLLAAAPVVWLVALRLRRRRRYFQYRRRRPRPGDGPPGGASTGGAGGVSASGSPLSGRCRGRSGFTARRRLAVLRSPRPLWSRTPRFRPKTGRKR